MRTPDSCFAVYVNIKRLMYALYPMYRNENVEPNFPYAICESLSGNIVIHFIRLPFVFEEDEGCTKFKLTNIINGIFGVA